ncbi:hypothetical protein E1180_11175 [Roseibium denhamense]|uniref:Uncharacterized protein n=1 Tax=Roseibium denhamense TaxID=76305 RepID=A0ABY1N6Z8_9HYPH|nr:hypothetical protein [Roseibium denhamense]MTI06074.1 hypothetical protein [Roseibium denhamense]SMP01426.1 hypothetical protein SAMN06265374_0358 [Roseibium denhamense]
MITIQDCFGMSGLEEAEILALAEHEHISEIAAAALGAYLLHQPKGADKIVRMIEDDIRDALDRGDRAHAKDLFMALRHFRHEHADELSRTASWLS